jgi:hypothetical protein
MKISLASESISDNSENRHIAVAPFGPACVDLILPLHRLSMPGRTQRARDFAGVRI